MDSKKINSLYYLEFLPIINNADEIWSLLSLLTIFSNDKFVQTLICHKLYSFRTVEVDYFLPQLCQLVIDKQADVSPVRNFLIDQCRRSSRSGLLSSFFFNAAALDNVPSTVTICQQMILDIELAALSGNKNSDYGTYMDLYKQHNSTSNKNNDALIRKQAESFKEGTGLTPDQIATIERLVFNIINNPIESASTFIQGTNNSQQPPRSPRSPRSPRGTPPPRSPRRSIGGGSGGSISERSSTSRLSGFRHTQTVKETETLITTLEAVNKTELKAMSDPESQNIIVSETTTSTTTTTVTIPPSPTKRLALSNNSITFSNISIPKLNLNAATQQQQLQQQPQQISPQQTPTIKIITSTETNTSLPTSPTTSPRVGVTAPSPRKTSQERRNSREQLSKSSPTSSPRKIEIVTRGIISSEKNIIIPHSPQNHNHSHHPPIHSISLPTLHVDKNSPKFTSPHSPRETIGFTPSHSPRISPTHSPTDQSPSTSPRKNIVVQPHTTKISPRSTPFGMSQSASASSLHSRNRTTSKGEVNGHAMRSTSVSSISFSVSTEEKTEVAPEKTSPTTSTIGMNERKSHRLSGFSSTDARGFTTGSSPEESSDIPITPRSSILYNSLPRQTTKQQNRMSRGTQSLTNSGQNVVVPSKLQIPQQQPPQNVSTNGAPNNINDLNVKKTKTHTRHTSCPVDLSNYKVKCTMCGAFVEMEKVALHTKHCDVKNFDYELNFDITARARKNSITNIHKKGIKPSEMLKLNVLTQILTDVVAIRTQNILNEEKIDVPLVDGECLDTLLQSVYDSTKTLELLAEPTINSQLKFSNSCKAIPNLHFNNINTNKIIETQTLERKYRRDYFDSQNRFVKGLTDISVVIRDMYLKTKELKNEALKYTLSLLNENNSAWTNNVYIPLLTPDGTPYRVLRIPPNDGLCLNSKFRVPYLINIEVCNGDIETDNISSCPEDASESEHADNNKSVVEDTTGTRWKSSKYSIVENYDSPLEHGNSILDDIFGQDWSKRKEKMRKASVYGKVKGWDLISIIVKGGDDLRQEQLAMQLIQLFADIFKKENLSCLQLRPYMVLATSGNAGFIETIHDAISIHGLKASQGFETLYLYFVKAYGGNGSKQFKKAQTNFIESIAAYSLVLYLLQIKDRHNGNILISREGHVIHIDYGFMLTSSPGNIDFEKSPFKLPLEMVEVMGGSQSEMFGYFKTLIGKGFLALRRNYLLVLSAVELMLKAGGGMTCFQGASDTITSLKSRFRLELTEDQCLVFCDQLVSESLGNWRSELYDNFQYYSNGIL